MFHSITFGEKNTFADWHIVAEVRPAVAPPEPVFIFDEIPGKSGSLDLTESLTGLVSYGDRTGSFSFLVLNGFGEWQARYEEIMHYLHGKRMKMTLEDDPDYYYIGRFKVGEWQTGQNWSNVDIEYQLDPFKYSHAVHERTINLTAYNAKDLVIRDIQQVTVPEITASDDVGVTFNNRFITIPGNTPTSSFAVWPDENGNTTLTFSASYSASVSVKYRRVRL